MSQPGFYSKTMSFLGFLWFSVFGAGLRFFVGEFEFLSGFGFFEQLGIFAISFATLGAVLGYFYPNFVKFLFLGLFSA